LGQIGIALLVHAALQPNSADPIGLGYLHNLFIVSSDEIAV